MKEIFRRLFWGSVGLVIAIKFFSRYCEKMMKNVQDSAKRNAQNFKCASSWLTISDSRGAVAKWLREQRISEIAIYGMGYLGEHLLKELENTDINIKYVIDRNPEKVQGKYRCCSPEEELPEVQTIIITPVYDFESIKESLKITGHSDLIPLDKILNSI